MMTSAGARPPSMGGSAAAANPLGTTNTGTTVNNTRDLERFQSLQYASLGKLAAGVSAAAGSGTHLSAGKINYDNSTANNSNKTSLSQINVQSKRKRQKLIDFLLKDSNWNKQQSSQSQLANNLIKLNKLMLVCEPNFHDEKSGHTPLTMAISSASINAHQQHSSSLGAASSHLMSSGGSPLDFLTGGVAGRLPPSVHLSHTASLFGLSGLAGSLGAPSSQLILLQASSASEIAQSGAPLVERLILLMVKAGARLDLGARDGRLPVHVAAAKSNYWALKTLLDLGAAVDVPDHDGLGPIYHAIVNKSELRVTQLLLSKLNELQSISDGSCNSPAPLGTPDSHGWQEIHYACKLGLDGHLEKLIYYGCDMNARVSGTGNTPLHVAAINDQLHCAKMLLLRGADKSVVNSSHQTAHQVAVIAGNLDLAELISEHTEAMVVPFRDRKLEPLSLQLPQAGHPGRHAQLQQLPLSAGGVSGSQPSPCLSQRSCATSNTTSSSGVCCHGGSATGTDGGGAPSYESASSSMTGGSGAGAQADTTITQQATSKRHSANVTVISIGPKQQLGSQATTSLVNKPVSQQQQLLSNHLNHNHQRIDSSGHLKNSLDMHCEDSCSSSSSSSSAASGHSSNPSSARSSSAAASEDCTTYNELYSLMLDERPLAAGALVEATSDYQSGDPSHLRLFRGDVVEVLDAGDSKLVDSSGKLPMLANKPMLFGRRLLDKTQAGLFPSFCVRRRHHGHQHHGQGTHHQHPRTHNEAPGDRLLCLANTTTETGVTSETPQVTRNWNPVASSKISGTARATSQDPSSSAQAKPTQDILVGTLTLHRHPSHSNSQRASEAALNLSASYRQLDVSLKRGPNEGFGFVLRGAKVEPQDAKKQHTGSVISEQLMHANKLVSLQYLDEIEPASVANLAGLKRGDFLVAVNKQDVRLVSHEQVVKLIRDSGQQVQLTIATPIHQQQLQLQSMATTTRPKVKPEPPKRDPMTTLSRNMGRQMQQQLQQQLQHLNKNNLSTCGANHNEQVQQFDANKPLPGAPHPPHDGSCALSQSSQMSSPSLGAHSATPQSSTVAVDSQSLMSGSTSMSSVHDHQSNSMAMDNLSLQQSPQQHSQAANQTTTVDSVPQNDTTSSASSTLTAATTMQVATKSQITTPGRDVVQQQSQQYQPAVITTTLRRRQSTVGIVDTPKQAANQATPVQASPQALPSPQAVPTTTDGSLRAALNQRRASLQPVSSAPSISGTLKALGSSAGGAELGSVAAACAALANNRMLRQQEMQKLEQQQQLKQEEAKQQAPEQEQANQPPPPPPSLQPQSETQLPELPKPEPQTIAAPEEQNVQQQHSVAPFVPPPPPPPPEEFESSKSMVAPRPTISSSVSMSAMPQHLAHRGQQQHQVYHQQQQAIMKTTQMADSDQRTARVQQSLIEAKEQPQQQAYHHPHHHHDHNNLNHSHHHHHQKLQHLHNHQHPVQQPGVANGHPMIASHHNHSHHNHSHHNHTDHFHHQQNHHAHHHHYQQQQKVAHNHPVSHNHNHHDHHQHHQQQLQAHQMAKMQQQPPMLVQKTLGELATTATAQLIPTTELRNLNLNLNHNNNIMSNGQTSHLRGQNHNHNLKQHSHVHDATCYSQTLGRNHSHNLVHSMSLGKQSQQLNQAQLIAIQQQQQLQLQLAQQQQQQQHALMHAHDSLTLRHSRHLPVVNNNNNNDITTKAMMMMAPPAGSGGAQMAPTRVIPVQVDSAGKAVACANCANCVAMRSART